MKRLSLLIIVAAILALNSNTMAQSEFSSGLIGVGVVCKDINKSLDFYLNVIGMTKVGEFDVDESFGKSSGLTDGLAFHVDVLKLQDSPDANQWKLMSFKKEGSHLMLFNSFQEGFQAAYHNGNILHTCIIMDIG